MDNLKTYELAHWETPIEQEKLDTALQQLEQGRILYFPQLKVTLSPDEQCLLTPNNLSPKRKNISWDGHTKQLRGCDKVSKATQQQLSSLLDRYAQMTHKLVHSLFPDYTGHIRPARTSFRPTAISQRILSPRKDDRLLHVDAFPSTPLGEQRLLRVFSNIHPHLEPRVWRTGGPFEDIAQRFLPKLKMPWRGSGHLLRALKITRARRRAYDHLMLQLHDAMKEDAAYQTSTSHQEISFPPGSTWIVCTDQVAHAALTGQYMLEQSFYLPVSAMQDPSQSPQRILERLFGKPLL